MTPAGVAGSWLRCTNVSRRHSTNSSHPPATRCSVLAGCAALIAVSIVRPEPPETTAIVVARHSLAAGHVITDSDVSIAQWPTAIGALPTARAISDVRGERPQDQWVRASR